MVMNALREIGMLFDMAIYSVVELLFRLILDLADLEIFSDSVITEFANRIYIILGLIMLFKIMISFIQILINPDKMDDKEQGVGNILKRVVFSLLLIVLVPSIFDLARDVQRELIPVIPKIVIGQDMSQNNDEETMNSAGRLMAWYSFSAFFTYYPGCEDGSILMGTNEDTASINSVSAARDVLNDTCPASPDGYRYKYSWPLTTAVGVYLVYVLVFLAISVAIRAIKLAICEFVAPIPIASYIDPKTSKQAFDNWVHTSITTYFDLFVRLIVVFFIVFVFKTVFDADNIKQMYGKLGGDWGRIGLVTLFIILGLLQFAKQAPKFISDMLGLKGGGDIMSMFKGAGSLFATTAASPFVGSRAAMLARAKSREAGEDESVQAYRARMAAASARGRFIADRLRGKKLKEGYTGAVDKAVAGAKNSIQRTSSYTPPGQRASMSDVWKSQKGYVSAKTRSYLGQAQELEVLDSRIENHKKIADMVSNGRKSMEGHKLSKAYRERYEAIKNTSEEVYQNQIRNSLSRQIEQLQDEYTNPALSLSSERQNEILNSISSLQNRLNDDGEIRNAARDLKFQETNDASRAMDDVQKRLFEFTMKGNTEDNYNTIFNEEDKKIINMLGLDRQGVWDDGEIMQNTRTATMTTQTVINNAMITDSEFANSYGGPIHLENMNFKEAGSLKDKSNKLRTNIENSPEYFEAKAKSIGINSNNS